MRFFPGEQKQLKGILKNRQSSGGGGGGRSSTEALENVWGSGEGGRKINKYSPVKGRESGVSGVEEDWYMGDTEVAFRDCGRGGGGG